ncbi:autotransporter outer membrane beta-barrel domain-containing protein [Bartonella heixiaziensis]|uniref:autotransporter family protein n=1 Tax=Bartonella heixiaziensis TaxID=1461000 RepID=UPI003908B9D6
MCKKSIYKKSFLLCTIAGTLIFSHFRLTYADTSPSELQVLRADKRGEEKTFNNVFVRGRFSTALADDEASIIIKNSTMRADAILLSAWTSGRIHAKKIVGKSDSRGLEIANGIVHIEDSIINVSGHHKSRGILFDYIPDSKVREGEEVVNKAILTNTKLLVENGIGILGPDYAKSVAEVVLKSSEIRSDILLKNKIPEDSKDTDPRTFILSADNSIIEGRTKTFPQNTTIFTLDNNSKWYLKISQFEVDKEFDSSKGYLLTDIKQRAQSIVSLLNLNNSSIIFKAPHEQAKDQYQTLHVGKQPTVEVAKAEQNRSSHATAVYNATSNAKIYFNTEWSDGLAKEQQKTDRVLVHGDISGTTTIHFNNLSKDEKSEAADSIPSNTRGLSLVQVFGKAEENSFKLAKGYITMDGLPYKYTLSAYGPTSSRGKANAQQSLLRENESFWDFRLQSATLDPEGKIKALVPQVASYLVLPNAVFTAGFAEVKNQDILLDNMRATNFGEKDNKKRGIFFSTHGNKVTLSSDRDPLQYGYGADVQHTTVQAGVTLTVLEKQDITTSFGLLGTYGKLAFTPKDMEGAEKSTLDKWSLAAYGSIQHNNGMYINALFSYGILKGNITRALIGNTAELNNTNTLSASATIGKKLGTNTEGLFFEPQAQLVYQRLTLSTFSDIDGFKVNMGNPHQWLVRVGGRLTQTILPTKEGCPLSFYGKLNVMKTFSDNGTIQIGDMFHLDSMGSSVEGGLGVNAHLSQNAVFHADVNYQHKLQKAGISGINFSGGIRYRF